MAGDLPPIIEVYVTMGQVSLSVIVPMPNHVPLTKYIVIHCYRVQNNTNDNLFIHINNY